MCWAGVRITHLPMIKLPADVYQLTKICSIHLLLLLIAVIARHLRTSVHFDESRNPDISLLPK